MISHDWSDDSRLVWSCVFHLGLASDQDALGKKQILSQLLIDIVNYNGHGLQPTCATVSWKRILLADSRSRKKRSATTQEQVSSQNSYFAKPVLLVSGQRLPGIAWQQPRPGSSYRLHPVNFWAYLCESFQVHVT